VPRVNESVVAALKAAANQADQPKEVAQRLVSWLDALVIGNAVITDNNEAAKRISDLLDLVRMPSEDTDVDDLDPENGV
jgi:hypothetical protein